MTALEINWERRFQDQVTANIRATAENKDRLHDVQLQLDEARRTIDALRAENAQLQPAAAGYAEERRLRSQALTDCAAKIQEMRIRYLRSKRQIMDDVIADLQAQADRLPAATP